MTSLKAGFVIIFVALAGAAFFSFGWTGGTQAEEGTGSKNFALINLSKVFNAHKGLAAADSEMNQFLRESEEELNREQKEFENLNNQLMVYSKGSEEHRKLSNEIKLKELTINLKKHDIVYERDVRMSQAMKKVVADVHKAVREYSREKGFTAVFVTSPGIDEVKSNRPEDVFQWLNLVNVFWSDDQLDISNAIITIINGS